MKSNEPNPRAASPKKAAKPQGFDFGNAGASGNSALRKLDPDLADDEPKSATSVSARHAGPLAQEIAVAEHRLALSYIYVKLDESLVTAMRELLLMQFAESDKFKTAMGDMCSAISDAHAMTDGKYPRLTLSLPARLRLCAVILKAIDEHTGDKHINFLNQANLAALLPGIVETLRVQVLAHAAKANKSDYVLTAAQALAAKLMWAAVRSNLHAHQRATVGRILEYYDTLKPYLTSGRTNLPAIGAHMDAIEKT